MTWTYAVHPAKQKSKLSKILGYKKNSSNISVQDSSQDSVYWPEDLLSKDFEDVRILTYGYDSQVSHFFKGPANQNNINAHGRSLLNALELYRRQDPRRRLIFIVHSLGGLILKEVRIYFYREHPRFRVLNVFNRRFVAQKGRQTKIKTCGTSINHSTP
jgi:hypothetical protein